MFEIKRIDDVIGERRLYLEGSPNTTIRVVLGRPQKAPGASEDDFVLNRPRIVKGYFSWSS